MAPTPKIVKDDILQAAFGLVRANGFSKLNARSIAKELCCSTQPIFSIYKNMEEMKSEILDYIENYFNGYFSNVSEDGDIFLNVGIAYVEFAKNEPNLFKALFMSDRYSGKLLSHFLSGDSMESIDRMIPESIDKDSGAVQNLFMNMWLYCHGIASMLVSNTLVITEEEVRAMISNMFRVLINDIGSEHEPMK